MAPEKDIKLNFDTPTEEIINSQLVEYGILPDKNCDICYGKGIMLASKPITQMPNDITYYEKKCVCITNREAKQARAKHLEQYRAA